MNWPLLALLTAVFFGAYHFFIKVASGHISQIVGAVVLQVVAALLGAVVLLILKMTDSPMAVSQKGLWFAVLAGVMVGLAEITSFFLFSRGVASSVGVPIIIGGSIVVAVLLGMFFLKETLTPMHFMGISLVLAGVVILTVK